ncbi:TonB-dependent receptor [Spongiibacter sp. KMU-166]|uniref:TonB-dependent receptor n=1 Tax=Spongiibacter thalassae TaxID=2721624 RepID=A0ABX1GJA7_9GAMM|nr:TonB-dependent receptor [Spongiibacter thalassae]NKI18264.1 TonB-dependent receptor [Spongiibacter thalassae]
MNNPHNRLFSTRLSIVAGLVLAYSDLGYAEPRKAPQIEEVLVTATKRTENLRDIPASIAHFSGAALEEQGKMNLAEFLQETPGVVINSATPGFMRISVRGIGIDNSPTATIPSPVGILVGDTSFTDPYIGSITPDLSAFDLASVEVLKGPQGTVFGGAALSGAVRYVLQDPHFEGVEARAFAQRTDVDHGGVATTSGVAVNIPLYKDTLAARVGYVKRAYPGLYDNRRSGEDDVNDGGGEQRRALVKWLPTDRMSLKLTYLDQDYEVDDAVFIADNREDRSLDDVLLDQPGNHDFSLASLELGYEFDTFSVMALSSKVSKNVYSFSDISATFASPPEGPGENQAIFLAFNHNGEATSHELRFQSSGDWWMDWIVGVYSYDYEMFFDIYVNTLRQQDVNDVLIPVLGTTGGDVAQETSVLYAFNNAIATEEAIFFDFSKTFWERLKVSAGARFYETVVEGGYTGYGALARAANNGQEVDIYEEILEDGVSPRYSVKYALTDEVSVYAQAAKGFRFGGIQTIPPSESEGVPSTYKSDKLWNYELGFRSTWFDNSLLLDAVVFEIDYKDPQIQQQTETTRLGFKNNVGGAESNGFEVSLKWVTPIVGLVLALDGGKVDAYTTEPFEDASGNMIAAGTQMPGAADSQYSASASYFSQAWGVDYNTYINYNYIGKSFGDLAQTEAVNDFATLNAGISLSMEQWRFKPQLAVNVTNIQDVTEPIGGSSRTLSTGEEQALFTLNAPRTLNARLSFEF